MKKTAFEKRIKRRIIAQEHTFFASCAPGLKTLLAQEIVDLNLESKKIAAKKGGVEFFGKIHDCYLANLHLRIPIRILMRIKSFKADKFSILEKKINEIDWELLLQKNSNLKFHISTKKSKLYHTDAIAQRVEKIISEKLTVLENSPKKQAKKFTHELFIRAENNRFEISLDSSGDLLHKRGIKENTTHAPLRENLAFAALLFAEFTKDDVLIDPMCGSGTFSLEASMFKQNIPAGFARNFAFQSWQCFRENKWNYIKKQAETKIESNIKRDIFASDIDDNVISSITQNVQKFNFNKNINIERKDFFDKLTKQKGVIIINPPYGKRIGSEHDISSFYNEIGEKLERDFKGWRVGIIMPKKHLLNNHKFQKSMIRSFYHGGLDIYLLTGLI